MTRARLPRPHEVLAARRDPRLQRAREANPDDPTWRAQGRCRDLEPELFFEDASESVARSVCFGCDVRAQCLAFALNAGANDGVYGATTPRERRAMLVAWRNCGQAVTR